MCLLASGLTYSWEHHIGAWLSGRRPPGTLGDTSGKGRAVRMELPVLGATVLGGHLMSHSSGVGSRKRWIGAAGCAGIVLLSPLALISTLSFLAPALYQYHPSLPVRLCLESV